MADINQQAEDLARAMERVNAEMAQLGYITKETNEKMTDAQMKAKYGMENFTKGTQSAAGAITELAGAGVAAGKAMFEGKKGAAAFNDSIDGMAKAAQAAGIALSLLIPGGPILKLFIAGITAAVTATAEYVKASNEMADKLYKGYSKMATSGAAASDGLTGMYKDAKKLGLSMNELDSFVGLVSENSKDLALFAGSAFEGRKKFAEMGEAMEPYRKGLIAAGYSQEQINEGQMGYLKLTTRMGAAQRLTTDQLAEGAKKYLNEQDALAKITGQTRKEMEANSERAMQQQQFASKIRELEKAGKHEEAKELMNLNNMYSAMGPKMASAFQASVTGNLANADALEVNMASQGEMMRTADLVSKKQMTAAEAAQATGKTIGQFNDDVNISLGGVNAAIGDFAEFEKARQLTEGNIVENMKKAEEERKKQGMDGAKAADGITDQYAKNIKQQQELNKKMEDAVFKGIDNALSITNKLGNVTNTLADSFTKLTTVINKLLSFFGLGEKAPEAPKQTTQREAEVAKVTTAARDVAKPMQERVDLLNKQLETDEKALKDAKRAGKYGAELEPLEKRIAANKEEYAKAAQELADQEKKIRDAAIEERKVRQQQALDQSEIRRIETMNLNEVERLAKLNEEKADLVKKGVDTAKIDQRIAETKTKIDAGKNKISELSKGLEMAPAPAGAKGGSSSSAPASAAVPTSVDQLKDAGLTVKQGDVQKEGAVINPKTIELAKNIQASLGGFGYFSGFNDKFHNEKSPTSEHTKGNALDFVMTKPPSKQEGAEIVGMLKSMGASVAIDEYNNPSSKSTAGHIHAAVPGYADGGIAETPQLAFVAEKGPEAMIPLVNGAIPIKIKLSDALSTPTFAGMNEYAGYNQGPMSTDLSAVKSIAEAVGAFDKVSQTITDPKMWKDILSSGLATNYQLGAATLGTQGIPGLGDDIAERLKEIKEQTNTDSESALKQVTEEFKSAMATMSQQLAQMAGNQNEGAMGGVASLLQELVTATKNGVDVQEKILATNY